MKQLTERFKTARQAGRLSALPIESGGYADYLALKPHHYRPGNPATITRAFVVRDPEPSAADRFLNRQTTPRCIAILTESLSTLSCRLRDEALGGRYGHLPPKPRSALLMREMRCISRVIVDPRYRGLGLAVRLVRHALATATTRYTESIAVMGKIHPFNEKAGMTAYERQALPCDQRALAALRYAGYEPSQLAMPSLLETHIARLDAVTKQFVITELTRWYRTNGGRGISRNPELCMILTAAQQRLLAQPVYYLHENTHVPTQEPAAESARPSTSDQSA